MRYRKRKKAASQVMVMTVVVLAVLATLMVLTCSQVFKVRSVLVVGNRNISKEDIIALSGVREGDNLFSLSDAELKKRLEQNWYIEYIGHEFDYRGTLTLHINERMGMGVVNAFGLYFVVMHRAWCSNARAAFIRTRLPGRRSPIWFGSITPVRQSEADCLCATARSCKPCSACWARWTQPICSDAWPAWI